MYSFGIELSQRQGHPDSGILSVEAACLRSHRKEERLKKCVVKYSFMHDVAKWRTCSGVTRGCVSNITFGRLGVINA